MSAYDFEFTALDGSPLNLKDFEGKTLLVVNTASKCGFTPQFRGLEELWDEYKDKGLAVIGVPSDDFNQEYDDKDKIAEVCEIRYGTSFPMTDVYSVKGQEAHPFFQWVVDQGGNPPKWNFNKVLISADGKFVDIYGSGVRPSSRELKGAIEENLPE